MSTPGVPPWGCPWHGLVRAGELELPNGKRMEFPQPLSGDTTLIRVPDLPEPSRTPQDVEAGRQWWREAILAGGTLHGRAIGGSGWIYVDSGKRAWLVRLQSPNDGIVNLTIRRFGILSGQLEQYQLTVAMDRPVGGNGQVRFAHATPTGNKAAWQCHGGWLQVSLAGSAETLSATVEVLNNAAETEGGTTGTNQQPVPMYAGKARNVISGFPNWEIESWFDLGAGSEAGAPIGENGERLVEDVSTDRTVAMYYGEDGGLVTITSDIGVRYTGTYSLAAQTGGRGYYKTMPSGEPETSFATLSYQGAGEEFKEAFIRLYRNGTLVLDETASWTRVFSYTRELSYYYSPSGDVDGPITATDDSTSTYSSGWVADGGVPTLTRVGQQLLLQSWCLADGQSVDMEMSLLLLSNVVQAPVSRWSGSVYVTQALSPSGTAAQDISHQGNLFGSWCPVTRELRVDIAPICYT